MLGTGLIGSGHDGANINKGMIRWLMLCSEGLASLVHYNYNHYVSVRIHTVRCFLVMFKVLLIS